MQSQFFLHEMCLYIYVWTIILAFKFYFKVAHYSFDCTAHNCIKKNIILSSCKEIKEKCVKLKNPPKISLLITK